MTESSFTRSLLEIQAVSHYQELQRETERAERAEKRAERYRKMLAVYVPEQLLDAVDSDES